MKKGFDKRQPLFLLLIFILIGSTFALIPLEWEYKAFDDFNVENSFNFGMRRSQLFFLEAGIDVNSHQNLLPLSDFMDILGSETVDLSKYSDKIMGNIGNEAATGGGFVRGLGTFGIKIHPKMAIGAFVDVKADVGVSIPNWVMEVLLEGNELITYPVYDEAGPIIDSSASIGGIVGFDTGWGYFSCGVGAYGPLMYGTLDRYAELSASPTAAGTVVMNATVYSPINLDLSDFSNIDTSSINYGSIFKGMKTDFSLILGEQIPICGVTLRDIPLTAAQLNYEATLFNANASFTSDPATFTSNIQTTDGLKFTQMSTPVDYYCKPTLSAFFNFPISEYLSVMIHSNSSILAGTYVGACLTANAAEAMLWSVDITTCTDGSMMYSGGLAIHNGLNTLKVNGGIGTVKPFDFTTLSAPRFSISTSINF